MVRRAVQVSRVLVRESRGCEYVVVVNGSYGRGYRGLKTTPLRNVENISCCDRWLIALWVQVVVRQAKYTGIDGEIVLPRRTVRIRGGRGLNKFNQNGHQR